MGWLDDIIEGFSDIGDTASEWLGGGSNYGGLDTGVGSGFDSSGWGNIDIPAETLGENMWSPANAYSDISSFGDTSSFGESLWSQAQAYSDMSPISDTLMYDQGGYQGLGIGNPDSYSNLPTASAPEGGWLDSINSTLQSTGKFLETPGGKLAIGLGGAGLSALGALKQNKLMKEAAKRQAEALAARQAAASVYDAPLRLANPRTQVAPEARRGESAFFANNRIPSYFAEGGSAGGLNSLRKYAQGRDIEKMMREVEGTPTSVPEISSRRSMGSEADAYAAETARLEAQALAEALKRSRPVKKKNFLGFCEGGALGYVKGGAAGQADTIDAKVSDGEYVIDADVVSALGDGNNEAGAAQLDRMRENIRTHKRAAPKSKIPPKAKSPLEYMKTKGAK